MKKSAQTSWRLMSPLNALFQSPLMYVNKSLKLAFLTFKNILAYIHVQVNVLKGKMLIINLKGLHILLTNTHNYLKKLFVMPKIDRYYFHCPRQVMYPTVVHPTSDHHHK